MDEASIMGAVAMDDGGCIAILAFGILGTLVVVALLALAGAAVISARVNRLASSVD